MTETQITQPLEEMAAFFDARVATYDDHMRGLDHAERFYSLIPTTFPETAGPIQVLDLGCGTGLELAGIFQKAPNALVTGIDLASGMLAELERKYRDRREQLTLIHGSYLEWEFPSGRFDYAVAVQTMHHFLPKPKLRLYRKIRRALRKGGVYIEGDYVVSPKEAAEQVRKYYGLFGKGWSVRRPSVHVDIPCCVKQQLDLLTAAGFSQAEVMWREGNKAIFTAKAR
jgi:tRNA (cmo5U34)-methyltransferase